MAGIEMGIGVAPSSGVRRREKVSERIAREVLAHIQDHGLGPGDRLPSEATMLEQWEVGRASLREALRILELNGVVTIRSGPGGGPVVSASDPRAFGQVWTLHLRTVAATYRELLEARVEYEAILARRTAEVTGNSAAELVRAAHERGMGGNRDDGTYAEVTSGFHTTLCVAGGNRVMSLAANAIQAVWARDVTHVLFPPDERPRVLADHEAIVEAIEAQDGAAAERLMRQHLGLYQQYCEERYRGRMDDVVDWSGT